MIPRLWLLVVLALSSAGAGRAAVGSDAGRALAIASEVERMAHQQILWPGFDPMAIPLAVYDGRRTYLFRHPAPPDGFSPLPGAEPPSHVYEGRHPAVTSNSSAELGGAITATLRADGDSERSPTESAAVALHEAFHVFQRQRHPGWQGNEGDLLLYPFDNAKALGLRRLETEAFRRALAAVEPEARCWSGWALRFRRERFAAMDSSFVDYEWRSELNEGLAQYVQERAAGRATVVVPESGFPPTQVRHRSYIIGAAMALLLDRFRPDWRESLEADDRQPLHELLAAALGESGDELPGPCALSADEMAAVQRIAVDDAKAVAVARVERRAAFDAEPGWRIVIQAAEGAPLWPQGFDPLNVERVEGGLLHTRFLRLGNDSGELSVVDEGAADLQSLTEGQGPHPLINGIRRVVVVGPARPEVGGSGGDVLVRGVGITASFKHARVRERGNQVIVELEAPE